MTRKNRSAYSLIELSVVIVIISILIAGVMTTATSNINLARNKVTKDRMSEIYEALGNYVALNGRLPCPANIALLKNNANYGISVGAAGSCTGAIQSTANANLFYGMVPTTTLGLATEMAEDGFGSKIAYIVDRNFTAAANVNNSPDFSQVNFSIYTVSGVGSSITVQEKNGTATKNVLSNGVFVLISYGANKKGAYAVNSTTASAASTDADEQNNSSSAANFDNTFVAISENSDAFDDILLYANPMQLVARFNLYSWLTCNRMTVATPLPGSTPDPNYPDNNSSNSWYGEILVGNACSGTDSNKFYTKKCGPAGSWILQASCNQL